MKTALVALIVVLTLAGVAFAETPPDERRLYFRGEYLLWWTKDNPTPVPLVTDSPLGAGTRVFLGGGDVSFDEQHGGRFTVGYWLTPDRTWGVEGSAFFLLTVGQRRSVAGSGAAGTKDLLIPFFDPTVPGENTTNLTLAGSFSGVATESLTSRLWGAELDAVRALGGDGPWRLELLGGLRYLNLTERLTFDTSSPDLPPGSASLFVTRDAFDADNNFYGAQLGVRGRYEQARWFADASVKLAVGVMHQSVDVGGVLLTNQFSAPRPAQAFVGGYFAQPTNIGAHSRDVVAVVPEGTVNIGYRLTSWASVVAGYTFLYASNVVRPGAQIDRVVNPTQSLSFGGPVPPSLAGAARPRFRFEGSDFWAQGLNVGIVLAY